MTLGPLMIGVDGPELTAETAEILRHPLVGGVILFARNYDNRRQLEGLVRDIHHLGRRRLLTAVDQEGGRVQRFRSGFEELPPLGAVGQIYEETPDRACAAARAHAFVMASELRSVQIDLGLAPCADLNVNREIIGDRAFHADPEIVAVLVEHYLAGLKDAGMAATVKHFPGHGSVVGDSHVCTPEDDRSLDTIMQCDMQPFRRAVVQGAQAVMMAHVIYSSADDRPASFSPFWIREVLRKQLSYAGAVFSDDVCMAGAEGVGDPVQRVRAAIRAGCDLVLVCDPDSVSVVLDRLEPHADPARLGRLAPLHGRHSMSWRSLHADRRWRTAQARLRDISTTRT